MWLKITKFREGAEEMESAKIFLYSCFAVCAGTLFASFFKTILSVVLFYWVVAIFLVLFSILAKKSALAVAAVFLIFFAIGFWRFETIWDTMLADESRFPNGRELEFSGTVADEVKTGENQKITVKPDLWPGRILISANLYPEYRYGDRLRISGSLREPPVFDGFDYKIYLAKSGIYSVMNGPKIERLGENVGSPFLAGLFWVKSILRQSLYEILPYPHNALLAGILFGDQGDMPRCSTKEIEAAKESQESCLKLTEEFNVSGLRHLTAVSGMHIAIMVPVLTGLGLVAGLWRSQAGAFAIVIVWLFIAAIGLPASAVRAGVMGTLMMAVQTLGRPANGSRLVILAAVLMVLQNPLLLRFDVGFQLSFLAVMGMIYLSPVFSGLLGFLPGWAGEFRSVLGQTLAAQVFTLPILIFNFGYISLYAPLANILAVPIISVLTLLGFLLAAAGLVSGGLSWIISLPTWLLVDYLLRITKIVSHLPYAALNFHIHWLILVLFYVLLWIVVLRLNAWRRVRFLGF